VAFTSDALAPKADMPLTHIPKRIASTEHLQPSQ